MNFGYCHQQKLKIPQFSGCDLKSDPKAEEWISQAELYFENYNVPVTRQVVTASKYLDGEADEWYSWYIWNRNSFKPISWEYFAGRFLRRFGTLTYEKYKAAKRSKLQQACDVVDCQEEKSKEVVTNSQDERVKAKLEYKAELREIRAACKLVCEDLQRLVATMAAGSTQQSPPNTLGPEDNNSVVVDGMSLDSTIPPLSSLAAPSLSCVEDTCPVSPIDQDDVELKPLEVSAEKEVEFELDLEGKVHFKGGGMIRSGYLDPFLTSLGSSPSGSQRISALLLDCRIQPNASLIVCESFSGQLMQSSMELSDLRHQDVSKRQGIG